jgi:hypothetical protein
MVEKMPEDDELAQLRTGVTRTRGSEDPRMLIHVLGVPLARSFRWTVLVGALYLICFGHSRTALSAHPPAAAAATWPRPPAVTTADVTTGPCRLAVLVVFDQMRADYLERWRGLWGKGGFRRLQEEAAWFTNCHYPFASTETGSGHATLATGRSPFSHGIVGNYWYDRRAGDYVYCVAGVRPYQAVPKGAAGEGPSTPERLLGPTVGDALREASGRKARVFALSLKDRSAVLLAGQRPDACYWFDLWTGSFMTSTYYRDRPHRWLAEFDRGRPADRWFGKDWTRLRPDLDYARHSGPTAAPGGATGWLQRRTFPHPTTGGLDRLKNEPYANRDYYGAVFTSPFGDELLLELAKKAIDAEGLGAGATRDLLCLSFSSIDAIGHSWGPDSQEMLDAMLRADRLVADLLAHLDARLGRGRYLLVLSADHGVCAMPELSRARGKDAGRVSLKRLKEAAKAILQRAYGAPGEKSWLEADAGYWLYLNQKLIAQRGLKAAELETTLARGLKDYPGILTAYTRSQLAGAGPLADPIGQALRRSFHPDRSGDVVVVLKRYYVPGEDLAGTTHGSPHSYDTHVPFLVYGPQVRSGRRAEAITPQAIPGVLATALGVAPPAGTEAPVPDIFQPKP